MVPGRTRRRSLIQAAGAAAVAALLPGREAEARELTADERERLAHGQVVKLPLDYALPRGDYFGGISYVVISATPTEVMATLNDPAAYSSILPWTMEARVVGKQGEDTKLFLKQGGSLGSASYVMVVRRESQSLLRFWMDPEEPHEIGDCWGYFRVQPWGKHSTLLTYAALLELDFGVLKLFTETIRKYALTTPALVKAYVQRHRPPE
jgi:hypothetical protein